jgi:hypothetical protein
VTGRRASIAPREVAVLIWAAHLALLAIFLGVVLALPPRHDASISPELLLALALATSVLGIACSRLLPPRIGTRQAGGRREVVALTRLIIAWSLCEGVAIFPLVAFLLVRDARLLAVLAVDVVALLSLFPSVERWAALSVGTVTPPPPTRMVR